MRRRWVCDVVILPRETAYWLNITCRHAQWVCCDCRLPAGSAGLWISKIDAYFANLQHFTDFSQVCSHSLQWNMCYLSILPPVGCNYLLNIVFWDSRLHLIVKVCGLTPCRKVLVFGKTHIRYRPICIARTEYMGNPCGSSLILVIAKMYLPISHDIVLFSLL